MKNVGQSACASGRLITEQPPLLLFRQTHQKRAAGLLPIRHYSDHLITLICHTISTAPVTSITLCHLEFQPVYYTIQDWPRRTFIFLFLSRILPSPHPPHACRTRSASLQLRPDVHVSRHHQSYGRSGRTCLSQIFSLPARQKGSRAPSLRQPREPPIPQS